MASGGAATILAARELRARPTRAVLTGLAAVVGVALVSGAFMFVDVIDRAGADENLQQVGRVVILAGLVALVVGSFVISSTLSVTFAHRSRELALLRCAGATPRQVRVMVRIEAVLVGLSASLVGLLLGFAVEAVLRAGATATGANLTGASTVLTPASVLVGCGLGLVAMLISSQGPARRAARTPPMVALHPSMIDPRGGRAGLVAGVTVGAAGLGGVLVGAANYQGPVLLGGVALTIVGMRVVGPRVVLAVAPLLRRPVVALAGYAGALGLVSAQRSRDRTAGAVSAVMIGVSLLTGISVLSASTKAYVVASAAHDPAQTAQILATIDRSTALYRTLSGLATALALVGVVIVLALSGLQRRGELGLLRAAGMVPRQVRTMIRTEAGMVAAVGIVLGTSTGVLVAWAAGRVLERSSAPTLFTTPWLTLVIIDVGVFAAAVAAATLPAWWAGRVDIVAAIATE